MAAANPMTRIETRYLHQHFAVSWRWHSLLLLLILPIAAIPFHTYITAENVVLLYLIMAVTFGLQLWLWARTVWVAARPIPKLNEDLLILTGIEGAHSVWGRWRAVVRHLWPDYVLVAVMRFGVAYGLVQIIDMGGLTWQVRDKPWHPLFLAGQRAFDYVSRNTYWHELYPDAKQGVLAIVLLVTLALVELGLLTAVGVFLQRITRVRYLSVLTTIMTRILMIVVASLLIHETVGLKARFPEMNSHYIEWLHYCAALPHVPVENRNRSWASCDQTGGLTPLWILRGAETVEVTVSVSADQGALLAANIMRPINPTDHYFGYYAYSDAVPPSYWPFVLRNIVSALIAIAGYAGLTALLLWMAGRISRRRGFL